jgi:hypothetical protein
MAAFLEVIENDVEAAALLEGILSGDEMDYGALAVLSDVFEDKGFGAMATVLRSGVRPFKFQGTTRALTAVRTTTRRGRELRSGWRYVIRRVKRDGAVDWNTSYSVAYCIGETVDNAANLIEKERAARAAGHGFKVGDLLYRSWGYDQTNVDFAQVVRVSGDRVEVREIQKTEGEQRRQRHLVRAIPDAFVGEVIKMVARYDATGAHLRDYHRADASAEYYVSDYY